MKLHPLQLNTIKETCEKIFDLCNGLELICKDKQMKMYINQIIPMFVLANICNYIGTIRISVDRLYKLILDDSDCCK